MRKSAVFSWVALLAAGCSSPGILVSRQEGNTPAKIGIVPADGSYGLFIAGQDEPLLQFPMKQGQAVGFDRTNVGQLTFLNAIANHRRVRLEIDKTYEWRQLSTPRVETTEPQDRPAGR